MYRTSFQNYIGYVLGPIHIQGKPTLIRNGRPDIPNKSGDDAVLLSWQLPLPFVFCLHYFFINNTFLESSTRGLLVDA